MTAATRTPAPPVELEDPVFTRTVFLRSLHEQRRGLLGWALGFAVTIGLMAAIWPSFSEVDFDSIMSQYPEALLEVFNVTSMGTPSGYLNAELFSLVVPAMVLVHAIGRGARLVAGEEEDGTLETLASLPVSRRRILLEKAGAVVAAQAVLGLVIFLSTWCSSLAVGMDLAVRDCAVAATAMFLMGFEFGLVSLAISAATGRRPLTVGIGSALAAVSYLLYLVAQLVDGLHPLRYLSPFYQAISEGPLGPSLPLLALVMPAVGIVVLVVALPLFDRRDLAT